MNIQTIVEQFVKDVKAQSREDVLEELTVKMQQLPDADGMPNGRPLMRGLSPLQKATAAKGAQAFERAFSVRRNGLMPMKPAPALAKARATQGKYLGALRRLEGSKRERVKKIAQSKGVMAALKFLGIR